MNSSRPESTEKDLGTNALSYTAYSDPIPRDLINYFTEAKLTDTVGRDLQLFLLASQALPRVPFTPEGTAIPGWESDLVTRWALASQVYGKETSTVMEFPCQGLSMPGFWPAIDLPGLTVELCLNSEEFGLLRNTSQVWPFRPVHIYNKNLLRDCIWQGKVVIPTITPDQIACATPKGKSLDALARAIPPFDHSDFWETFLQSWMRYETVSPNILLHLMRSPENTVASLVPQTIEVVITIDFQSLPTTISSR